MWRKWNRLKHKHHKRPARSPALTAFLVRICFLPAIWEFPVSLMPTLHRVFAHAGPSSLTPHPTAVLLSDTQGRSALQTLPKQACFMAVIAMVPMPEYSPGSGKTYSTEESEGMGVFNNTGCRPGAEMSFLSLTYLKAPCDMKFWDRQHWDWRNAVS